MAFQVHILSIPIGDPAGDDAILLFKAPENAKGGGIKIIDAEAVNMAATGAGTSFTLALHKYSNAATPVVNGTITDTIGATSDPWVDSKPKAFAITEAQSFIDAGEWVVLNYVEQTSGNPTKGHITIHYVMGK